MKCVCGYEKTINYISPEESVNPKGKDFIRIFTETKLMVEESSWERYEVTLNACPECNTVKMEKSW